MSTVWDDVLARVRTTVEAEEFRRWFGSTAYASDAVDQITDELFGKQIAAEEPRKTKNNV